MLRKFYFILLCFFPIITIYAQPEKGYNISIKLLNHNSLKLYLIGNYGYDHFIADSALIKKNGIFQFSHKNKTIPSGIYQVADESGDSFFELIIDRERDFSIITDPVNPYFTASIENSQENRLFFEYMKVKSNTSQLPENYLSSLTDISPNSLLSIYIKAEEYRIPVSENTDIQSYKDHFFKGIAWNDARILHLPIQYGIDVYFDNLVYPTADSMNKEIDDFFEMISNSEVKHYFLEYLFRKFDNGDPQHDAILVYLFDNYCSDNHCDWLDSYSSRRFAREVKRKRNTLPGQPVPPLVAYNVQGEVVSTGELQHQFIILWFWDPDCDDCLIETPILYNFYEKYRNMYDIEVYAVSITEDVDRWEQFIIDNRLDWINVSYGKGETNYDFVEYFDLLTTPGIFLLDENHIIIDRQFPVDDIMKKIIY